MPVTPLPLTNGFYESDSLPLSAQQAINVFLHFPDEPSLNSAILFSTPGLQQVATAGASGSNANRGGRALGQTGRPYFVQGQSLYRLNKNNTTENLGTIVGTGRVSMADNGTQLMILVPSGKGYIFTEEPDTLVEITDSDFRANGDPQQVEFVDGYFVCTTDEKKFIISSINDGKNWNALDFGSAESAPDGVVTPFVYRNQLFIGGERSTEAFSNVGGTADFPFRRTGLFLDEGVSAPFSVVKAKNSVMFIGAGENEGPGVYQLIDNATRKISTKPIDRLLQAMTQDQLNAVAAWFYSEHGHFFTGFVLPTTTIVYDSATEKWHERRSRIEVTSGVFESLPWRAVSIVSVGGITYAGDTRDGRIGILDIEYVDEYGEEIVRQWTTQPFQNNMRPIFVPQLELTVESGVGERLSFGAEKFYDSGSYLAKLVEVVDGSNDGGVWVFDEDDAADHVVDQTGNLHDLSDFGTPTVLRPSFIDDNRNSTTVDANNGYRDTSAPYVQLSGTVGVAFNYFTGGSHWIFEVSHNGSSSDRLIFQYVNTTTIKVSLTATSSVNDGVEFLYTGDFTEPRNIIIRYSLTDGGTAYSVETFVDFVSQGVETGNVSTGTFSRAGPDLRMGSAAGGGGGADIQYGFYMDSQITNSQISELEDEWNRNQIGYVDPSPTQPTPENVQDPSIRLAVSRDGGRTYSDERVRKIGKIGEYAKRVIWRRNGRSDRFDVYRFITSDPVKFAALQLTATLEGEDSAAA